MSVVAAESTELGVRNFGGRVAVPDDNTAKLMYYLNCMCVVLDLADEPGLAKLIDYPRYHLLTEEEKAALFILCIALNPAELNDKCLSQVESIPGGLPNQFLELSATSTNIVASDDVVIAGRHRRVTKVMLYTMNWILRYYIVPLKAIADASNRRQSSGCCTIL